MRHERTDATQVGNGGGVSSHARVTLDDGRRAVLLCNSYNRMQTVLALASRMAAADWLALLGEAWTICDNIGTFRRVLRRILPAEGPVVEMMTPDERTAYAALPERLTLYRGCGSINMLGASWSLSRDVATRIPGLHRYFQRDPLLITGKVVRRRVLAVKLDREEAEVITFAARRISIERLIAGPTEQGSAS